MITVANDSQMAADENRCSSERAAAAAAVRMRENSVLIRKKAMKAAT